MKKTLSIVALALVAVMMMSCLVACGGGGGKLEAGTYKLTEVSGEGASQFESMKDSITLDVQDGGKAAMNLMGSPILEMQFNESTGKVDMSGSEAPYTVSGNKITIEDASGKMVFEK